QRPAPPSTLFPYTTLFRSELGFLIEHFTTNHGARIAEEIGIDLNTLDIDLSDLETMMGAGADGFNYTDIQDRRLQMRSKMQEVRDRKSTRLNSSHRTISYA